MEYGSGMVWAGFPSFFGLGLENSHSLGRAPLKGVRASFEGVKGLCCSLVFFKEV